MSAHMQYGAYASWCQEVSNRYSRSENRRRSPHGGETDVPRLTAPSSGRQPCQKLVEVSALVCREWCEKPFLHSGHRRADCDKTLAPAIGEVHLVCTAIRGRPPALRQPLTLKLVHEVHHRGLVDLERVDQLLLRERSTRVHEAENPEMPDVEVPGTEGLRQRVAQATMRALEEEAGLLTRCGADRLARAALRADRSAARHATECSGNHWVCKLSV